MTTTVVCVDKLKLVDVAGTVCESSDVIAKWRRFPDTNKGGLIAIISAGA